MKLSIQGKYLQKLQDSYLSHRAILDEAIDAMNKSEDDFLRESEKGESSFWDLGQEFEEWESEHKEIVEAYDKAVEDLEETRKKLVEFALVFLKKTHPAEAKTLGRGAEKSTAIQDRLISFAMKLDPSTI